MSWAHTYTHSAVLTYLSPRVKTYRQRFILVRLLDRVKKGNRVLRVGPSRVPRRL